MAQPVSLAVAWVTEAANRKNTHHEWQRLGGFGAREIDLWVLMTILPEREGRFHFTRPYLQTASIMLVRADSPVRRVEDLKNPKVSSVFYGVPRPKLKRLLRDYRDVKVSTSREAILKLSS